MTTVGTVSTVATVGTVWVSCTTRASLRSASTVVSTVVYCVYCYAVVYRCVAVYECVIQPNRPRESADFYPQYRMFVLPKEAAGRNGYTAEGGPRSCGGAGGSRGRPADYMLCRHRSAPRASDHPTPPARYSGITSGPIGMYRMRIPAQGPGR